MSKISVNLIMDAWLREAQEASHRLEDSETGLNHNHLNLAQMSIIDSAGSKLLELGVKLDRLESLLRDPPTKPILPRNDPAIGSKEYNGSTEHCDQDLMKTSYSQDQSELLKPLLSDDANRSQVQNQPSSFMSMISLRKACFTFFFVLGIGCTSVRCSSLHSHLANGIHVAQIE